MSNLNEHHFAAWFLKGRQQLKAFALEQSTLTQDERLTFIRSQYNRISLIRKVVSGEAEFVGTPARTLAQKEI